MGLCRCRVVTNLFCFEHKTNVCEKCIVASHPRCVVKSYLQWLRDSDFDATCSLCRKSLQVDDVLRLTCLDLFHASCLERYAAALPDHTARAGYGCPICSVLSVAVRGRQTPIIPPDNAASPLAVALLPALRNMPWARKFVNGPSGPSTGGANGALLPNGTEGSHHASVAAPPPPTAVAPPRQAATTGSLPQAVSSRKQPSTLPPSYGGRLDDDDDKYRQRKGTASRLFWRTFGHINEAGETVVKRGRLALVVALLVLVGVVTLYYALSLDVGTGADSNDGGSFAGAAQAEDDLTVGAA